MPIIKTPRGLDWNYASAGDGETLFFIHGFAGGLRLWQAQRNHFQTGYSVVAVDLPGHGQSAWLPSSLNDLALDLKFIWQQLDLHQVNVVASSFGGLLALKLFRICPERFGRMSFVGALPRFTRTVDYPAGLDIDKIRRLSQQFKDDYPGMLDIFFRSLFSRRDREDPSFAAVKALRAQDKLPLEEAAQTYLNILEKEDLRDVCAGLPYRVQFISGTEDYICPVEVMPWLREAVPHGRFDMVEGAGHLPFLSRPIEYNQHLEDFLRA